MKEQHLWQLLEGLGTSLQLTAASLLVGCILSLLMTVSLVMRTPVVHWFSRAVITLFSALRCWCKFSWCITALDSLNGSAKAYFGYGSANLGFALCWLWRSTLRRTARNCLKAHLTPFLADSGKRAAR